VRRTTWTVGAVMSILVAALVTAGGAHPAVAATSYPSWGDVQAAKANAAATQAQVDRINGLLTGLQAASNAAGDLAVKRAGEYGLAELSLQKATTKATDLQTRADAAKVKAAALRSQSGKLAEQMGRAGGSEYPLRLFLTSDDSKTTNSLLYQLGAVAKLGANASRLFAAADEQKNLADSLSAQATSAQKIRDQLASKAKTALDAAKSAQAAAEAELASQQEHATTLYAQLALLKNTAASVEQQYAQGVAQAAADAKAANRAAGAGAGWVSAPSGMTVDPAAARAYAASQLGRYGWGSDQMSCLVRLWNQESGWRANAVNPSSDAYGIAQALPPEKMSSAGPDWLTNADTQINWGLTYIKGRYGSPCGAWAHEVSNNWY
jgi:septal ring factor EnvC (AmiA/AmiB activator)